MLNNHQSPFATLRILLGCLGSLVVAAGLLVTLWVGVVDVLLAIEATDSGGVCLILWLLGLCFLVDALRVIGQQERAQGRLDVWACWDTDGSEPPAYDDAAQWDFEALEAGDR